MHNHLGFKLIAVLDINILILFKSQGLKIIKTLQRVNIHGTVNHKTEKHEGFRSQSKVPSSFYDPHSSPKDIEYTESSRTAAKYIHSALLNDSAYKGLFLVADAKMLGSVRKALDKQSKSLIIKEIPKNMTKHSTNEITKAVFLSSEF